MPNRYTRNRLDMTAAEITAAYMDDFQDELLDAAVTAAALTARADGTVEPGERREMLDVLRRNGLLSVFTRFEVIEAFESRLRQLDQPGGVGAAVAGLGRLAGRSPARVAIEAGERVAAAGRDVDAQELQILRLIRSALGRRADSKRRAHA